MAYATFNTKAIRGKEARYQILIPDHMMASIDRLRGKEALNRPRIMRKWIIERLLAELEKEKDNA